MTRTLFCTHQSACLSRHGHVLLLSSEGNRVEESSEEREAREAGERGDGDSNRSRGQRQEQRSSGPSHGHVGRERERVSGDATVAGAHVSRSLCVSFVICSLTTAHERRSQGPRCTHVGDCHAISGDAGLQPKAQPDTGCAIRRISRAAHSLASL